MHFKNVFITVSKIILFETNIYADKSAVTFVTRYKSNQKNFWGYKHFATADER